MAAESFDGCATVSDVSENLRVLITRRDNTLYVHLNARPITDGVCLWPFNGQPARATLLNDGRAVETEVAQLPNSKKDQRTQLHLKHLPIREFSDEVMIVKLEFEDDPVTA